MASNSDNNLLIDLDQTTEINSAIETNASQKMPGESDATITDSVSLFRSSEPLYKLLGSQAMGSVDSADNNPFDCMVKQAGLLDDPFEIVENAAKANPATNVERQHVEMGTLISLDSMDVPNSSSEPKSEPEQGEVINMTSPSSDNNQQESIIAKEIQNCIQADNLVNDERTPPPATVQNPLTSMVHNMSTPLARSSGKKRSNALHLLKFSLSKSRMDSASDNGSPISIDHESSSGDEQATILHKQMLSSETLMLRTSNTDESFDDLSATKPNWVDSETDMENDSDLDNDIAKLNIPMLTTKTSTVSDETVNTVGPTVVDKETIVNDAKAKEQDAVVNRDRLMEKLASIKLKHPSPTRDEANNETVEVCHDANYPQIKVTDENQISGNEGACSAFSASLKAENSNSLIENLKKIVDQCDDKQRQSEAKALLESLSTILKFDSERKQVTSNRSSSSFERVSPQPIVRQGTFSIDHGPFEKKKREISPDHDTVVTPKLSDESSSDRSQASSGESGMNPALSQVLKDLQSVLGTNQCLNVVQTNMQPQKADGTNPTYIVVMNASTNDTMEMNTSQLNASHRLYRSQSFSSRDRPVAAVRAAQTVSDQQRQQQSQTPVRRPALTRRSSFGSITRLSSIEQAPPPPKPSTTILRRRSLQGPMPTSNMRPPSPKSSLTAKSTISSNLSVPVSVPAKRRSFGGSTTAATKDSPSKAKSSYSIMKKPQAPPLVRSLKIRVKESLTGRSSAPMRAVVPMNRVAPMIMINESVSPMNEKRRKDLITSTPRSLGMTTSRNTSIQDYSRSNSTSAVTPTRPIRRDTSFASLTPKPMMKDAVSKPTAPQLTRRRSLSDHRGIAAAPAPKTTPAPAPITTLKSANKLGNGLLNSALGKFAQSKLTKIGLGKSQPAAGSVRSKENNIPK